MTYTPGALRAIHHMTREWQLPGRATFNAFGAFSATNQGLAEAREVGGGKSQYRLTDLGEREKGNG